MTTRTRFVSIVTMALVLTWSSCVNAGGIVTINFPADLADPCPGGCSHNTTADGFRISPEEHYDRVVVGFPDNFPGIGWDQFGDNSDYLGSYSSSRLLLSFPGRPLYRPRWPSIWALESRKPS
jgi:hypothetical protein